MKDNPYLVEPSENPQKAIEMSIEKGLLEKFKIDENIIDGYLNSKNSIPIWILDAACEINKKDYLIPIQYQNLWYCLHNSRIKRTQPTGRVFRPIIRFAPVYIESNDKIIRLLKMTIIKCGNKKEFAKLCKVKISSINFWLSRKYPIPITAIEKISQFTNIDISKIIDNCWVYSKTSRKGTIFFNCAKSSDLESLLTWIKTDGHLNISSPHIEINQKSIREKKLQKLKSVFIKTFKLNISSIKILDAQWGGKRLIIDSAPLRSILCLIYDIPIGYKVGSLKSRRAVFHRKEDLYKILASYCETEGSFTQCKSHGFIVPRFEFSVKDKCLRDELEELLKRLGYKPRIYDKRNEYKLGIYEIEEFMRLVFEIFPYVDKTNKDKVVSFLRDRTLLYRLNIKSEKSRKLLKKTRKIFITNRKFSNILNKRFGLNTSLYNISNWINSKYGIQLAPIILSCDTLSENYFKYIPNHFSILLYSQKLIPKDKFNSIRGNNDGL